VCKHVGRAPLQLKQAQNRPCRARTHIEPYRLPGWSKRGVRKSEAERLPDYLRSCRGAEELTSAAGRGARAAAHLRCVFERDLLLRVSNADGLHLAGILTFIRKQGYAAGDKHRRGSSRG